MSTRTSDKRYKDVMKKALRLLSSGKEPNAVLQDIAEIGSKTMESLCGIVVVDQGSRELRAAALHCDDNDLLAECRRLVDSAPWRIGIGIIGRAVETGYPGLWHADDGEPDLADQAFVDAMGAKSVLAVPIPFRTRFVGALVSSKIASDVRPDEAEIEFASLLTEIAAGAVQNVRLMEEFDYRDRWRRGLISKLMEGQEGERAKLARQLHDDASQLLSTVLIELTGLEQAPQDQVKERVKRLREETDSVLSRVHDMVADMRPPAVDDVGLAGALRRYVGHCRSNSDIKFDFVAVDIGPDELSLDAQVSVYRIAQEALLNVVRHSGAQFAGVTLERRKGMLVLTVEDDGHGFDFKKYSLNSLKRCLGLFGMKERAALLGGITLIDTSSGGGTTVTVRVPLEKTENG